MAYRVVVMSEYSLKALREVAVRVDELTALRREREVPALNDDALRRLFDGIDFGALRRGIKALDDGTTTRMGRIVFGLSPGFADWMVRHFGGLDRAGWFPDRKSAAYVRWFTRRLEACIEERKPR